VQRHLINRHFDKIPGRNCLQSPLPASFCKSQPPSVVFLLKSTPHRNCRHSVAHWATMNSEVDSLCGELTLAKISWLAVHCVVNPLAPAGLVFDHFPKSCGRPEYHMRSIKRLKRRRAGSSETPDANPLNKTPKPRYRSSPTLPYRGTSLIRNSPPPQDHHRTLGIVLL